MHPDYLSTGYARALEGVETVAVQHHHAHVASAMAEHGLDRPVIGVTFDGTGYGTDGDAWGGEVLIADYREFVRFATCRAVPLAGGDAAIRQPWRVALALLEDAFAGDPPLSEVPLFEWPAGRAMSRWSAGCCATASTRRSRTGWAATSTGSAPWRSAAATARFESQLALAFNVAADPDERGCYPWELTREADVLVLDFRRAVREVTFEVIGRAPVAAIAARFHNTIAAATAEVVRAAARQHRGCPVVLTGGCFQNARLTETLADDLSRHLTVYTHRQVPPGDGGIALGQVAVAGLGR